MLYYTILATLAAASLANAQAESGISSLISKYSTKSGWSAFFTPLESKIQNFGVTQTFISLSDLTRTDTGIITVPGFVSLASEYVTIVSEAIATDTNLAPTDKSSLSSDFEALIAGATGSASVPSETGSGSKGPSETATETGTVLSEQASPTVTIANPTQISAAATTQAALPTQTGGAGANMDMLGLSGVVAGLVAAVAMAL